MYDDVLKGWLLKLCKTPLITLIKQNEDIDFVGEKSTVPSNQKLKFNKIAIRVKSILEGLVENTTKTTFPGPLLTFLG